MTGAFKKSRQNAEAERAGNINALTGKPMNLFNPSPLDIQYMQGIANGTMQKPETTLAQTDAKKGATGIEKLNREKKERSMAYGGGLVFTSDQRVTDDTTLSSGSLLNLGSRLG